MSPLFQLILFQLALVVSAQKMTFLRPSSIPQCDTIALQWTGGTPPFTMVIAPSDDSGISAASFEQDILGFTTPFLAEWPAGTQFSCTVTDNNGQSATTEPPLTIGPSSNSSCLDPDFLPATDSDTDSATSPTISSDSPLRSLTATSESSTHSASATKSPDDKDSSKDTNQKKGPPIAVIIGVVAGVSGLIGFLGAFFIFRRRLRNKSSKQNFAKTWGEGKGLDGEEQGRPPTMVIPDPFVYNSPSTTTTTTQLGSNSQSNLIRQDTTRTGGASVDRHPTTSSRSRTTTTSRVTHVTNGTPVSPSTPGGPQGSPEAALSPETAASRKGERFLPDFWSSSSSSPQPQAGSQQQQGGTPGSSATGRIQDEDIDRLAARMVALMSSGRMTDQAWTPPARRGQQITEADLDDDDDDNDEGLPGYVEATRGTRPLPAPQQ